MSTTYIAVLRALVEQLADPAVSYVLGGPGGIPQPRKDAIDELLHAMPALLDELERARADVDRLRKSINDALPYVEKAEDSLESEGIGPELGPVIKAMRASL